MTVCLSSRAVWGVASISGLLALSVSSVRSAEPLDIFQFDSAQLNHRITHCFHLHNASTDLLEIRSVTTSCDCVQVLKWTPYVDAGATGDVWVVYVPGTSGDVDYRVFLKTSDPEKAEVEYAIRGVVEAISRPTVDRDWSLYLGSDLAEEAAKNPQGILWVDVREGAAHERTRIPESLPIPLPSVKTKGFMRGRRVVLVDEGFGNPAMESECRRMRELGFSDVSLWYGGLNAWRRLGGVLEGTDHSGIPYVHPRAVYDIMTASDWLLVAVDAGAADALGTGVEIPFDAGKNDAFIRRINSELEFRSNVGSVLIVSDTGDDYGDMMKVADEIQAFVFFLEGGGRAWRNTRQMMKSVLHPRAVMVQRSEGGSERVRPAGCGGCGK